MAENALASVVNVEDEFGEMTKEDEVCVAVKSKKLRAKVKMIDSDKAKEKAPFPQTPRQRFVKSVLIKAGVAELPSYEQLIEGMDTNRMPIRQIGLFINPKNQKDELLAYVAADCPVENKINLSAEVKMRRVKQVAIDLVSSGLMFMPIMITKIGNEERIECYAGRHRLAALALLYGTQIEVPVYFRSLSTAKALDATAYANDSRPRECLEKAEHKVLKATGGFVQAPIEETYVKAVTKKSHTPHFSAYVVLDVGLEGAKLGFDVSKTGSRKNGETTTVGNMMGYWKKSIRWTKDMPYSEYESELKGSCAYINALVAEMKQTNGFRPEQHLSAMTMVAIGSYYRTSQDYSGDAMAHVKKVAETLVDMGDIGRQRSEKTYHKLVEILKKESAVK